MKIGVTQIVLPGYSLRETLQLCVEAGYEAVELVFGEHHDPDIKMSFDQIEQVGKTCANAGVEISSILGGYKDRGNLLSRSRDEQEAGRRSLLRMIDIAGTLGVGAILLHPGQLTGEGTYQQAWDTFLGILKEVEPVARARKVVIAVENVWNKFLLSPKEMREFVDQAASEWIGTYLDTANMMAYGFPEHWIRELGSRIKRVHFKDFQRGQHRFVPLMEGDTDWPGLMHDLRTVGYDSFVVHEVSGDEEMQKEMARRMQTIVTG